MSTNNSKGLKFFYRLSDDTIVECNGDQEYFNVWSASITLRYLIKGCIYLFLGIILLIIFAIITPLEDQIEIFKFIWGLFKIVFEGLVNIINAFISLKDL